MPNRRCFLAGLAGATAYLSVALLPAPSAVAQDERPDVLSTRPLTCFLRLSKASGGIPKTDRPPMSARLTFRLGFDGDQRLGPGKIALLEAIRKTGSISAAGREFDMSYRRAWLLVDELNQMFEEPLVSARGGGRGGGGAHLTENGETVVELYRAAERKMARAAKAEVDGIERRLSRESATDAEAPQS